MPQCYVDIIMNKYKKVVLNVLSIDEMSSEYLVTILLHQRSILSYFLFNLVMDELTKEFQDEVPRRLGLCCLQLILP